MKLQMPELELMVATWAGMQSRAVTVILPLSIRSYRFVASAASFDWANFTRDEQLTRVGYPAWISGYVANYGYFMFKRPVPLRLSPYDRLHQVAYRDDERDGIPAELTVRWATPAELLKQYRRH